MDWRSLTAMILAALAGCAPRPAAAPATAGEPLEVQQRRACAEAAAGAFVSLADFEPTTPDGLRRDNQARRFAVIGGGSCREVLDVTRTGTTALAVRLEPAAALVYTLPATADLRPWTLLAAAVYLDDIRDDLQITLAGPGGTWHSRRRLLQRGWNTVLIDLNDLRPLADFDLSRVETITLRFADAVEPVALGLDDILLIDNRRYVKDTPAGLTLMVDGLSTTLRIPGRQEWIRFRAGADGLWRPHGAQPVVQLAGPDAEPSGQEEDLRLMGERRLGRVELLEANPLRVRIANTWYFPPQAGRWIDMDVRQIRWEYTFYGDGRQVTHMALNNAGGRDLTAVHLDAGRTAAWDDGREGPAWEQTGADLPAVACALLTGPPDDDGEGVRRNYLAPAPMVVRVGRPEGDGFDETQGCYAAVADRGHCRVELRPAEPLHRPALRIRGRWCGPVAANADGTPLRPVVPLDDGVLIVIPATLTAPTLVEVAGPIDPLEP
ncbi:MAG: hypothetical protein GX591_05520 [Planctomycetes bacterium]|nr:hypothetical protein [Planctomycetota bacterium]